MLTVQCQRISERQVQGVKQLEQLLPLVERLHEVGCQRDKAGNRQLHMDQYCLLILLYFYNPIVTSLRNTCVASDNEPKLVRGQDNFRCTLPNSEAC